MGAPGTWFIVAHWVLPYNAAQYYTLSILHRRWRHESVCQIYISKCCLRFGDLDKCRVCLTLVIQTSGSNRHCGKWVSKFMSHELTNCWTNPHPKVGSPSRLVRFQIKATWVDQVLHKPPSQSVVHHCCKGNSEFKVEFKVHKSTSFCTNPNSKVGFIKALGHKTWTSKNWSSFKWKRVI